MENRQYREGIISALVCNIWWGIMPIYWQWLRPIESSVIIYYRIFLVALVSFLIAWKTYGIRELLILLKQKGLMLKYLAAGILITANWSIYIWAVNANYVVQTCIGYYIEPLIICSLGIIIFKEKLSKYKIIALSFATLGVAVIIIYFKQVPLIALSVAVTFSLYAALKKNLNMPPIKSLFYETIFLAPVAFAIIIYMEITGNGAIGAGKPYQYGLLMLCGLFTAFPLALFANATNKINLFVVGIVAYISPTISLVISIFLFREPFEQIQLVSFLIIWIGLGFFSYGEYIDGKNTKKNRIEGSNYFKDFPGNDRLEFPEPLIRVTGGLGGEAILICGEEKTALYDCGMACFGNKLVNNISKVLEETNRKLDFVIVSHTHYDHIGGLPYVLKAWPKAKVYGSKKAYEVFNHPHALNTIKKLGEIASKKYKVEDTEICIDGMRIDEILYDGDELDLGNVKIIAYETKGHTDCSVSYYILPFKVLLASESTGVCASPDFISTSPLKSVADTITAARKMSKLDIQELIIPHFGKYPKDRIYEYFNRYIEDAEKEKSLIIQCFEQGKSTGETFEKHKSVYWSDERGKEQPFEAYKLNAEIVINQLYKEWKQGEQSI